MTTTPRKRRPGAIAQRANQRPAHTAHTTRALQPVTNAEFFEQRRRAREADVFETLFAKLLRRVK